MHSYSLSCLVIEGTGDKLPLLLFYRLFVPLLINMVFLWRDQHERNPTTNKIAVTKTIQKKRISI